MASTDSLLDAHEVAVRARVEELREQAARVAAELSEAELALEHVAITKATLAVVLVGGGQAADGQDGNATGQQAASERAAVPPWNVGLDGRALPAGYRELWAVQGGGNGAGAEAGAEEGGGHAVEDAAHGALRLGDRGGARAVPDRRRTGSNRPVASQAAGQRRGAGRARRRVIT
ncbi:MAG: hypothetical protein HOV87_33025 [Catenulispora sp.]|nr:hypothetical protein [Catenulispora sp.]